PHARRGRSAGPTPQGRRRSRRQNPAHHYRTIGHPRRRIAANLENRRMLTRLIREWKADLVFSHRPNDYHPDHRYTGILVQDAAYMVTVPFFCPDVPPLKNNPVFMYYSDDFQKPNPFRPDIVV